MIALDKSLPVNVIDGLMETINSEILGEKLNLPR